MSESELSTYQLQLQQVEAALTSDPANSELLKLKTDLEQVINLTKTLIEQQVAKSNQNEEEEEEEETGELLALFAASLETLSTLHENLQMLISSMVGGVYRRLCHRAILE